MDWCILRTAGRSTLPLAESLARSGFEVWTPRLSHRIRVPRCNVRRVVVEPLLKGFVFAAYRQRHDLCALANGRERHARFKIMTGESGAFSGICDRELEGLRWIEAKLNVATKAVQRTIPVGVTVRVSTGLFSGMTGVVKRSKRGLTMVCFNDRYATEIPTSILEEDVPSKTESAIRGLALAA